MSRSLTFLGSAVLAMLVFVAMPASAQVVTSYYAPPVVAAPAAGLYTSYSPGPVLTPGVVTAPVVAAPAVAPVVTSPIVGSIPVRRGLFGLRTEHVPVFAGAPVVAAPVTASPVVGVGAIAPYAAARPIISTTPVYTASPSSVALPNTLIQSGYRGTTTLAPAIAPASVAPVTLLPAALPSYPYNGSPLHSFTPSAVMTMQ